MLAFLASSLVGCVVGDGDGSWAFDGATSLDVELGSGDVKIRPSTDGTTVVGFEGGGVGQPARPDVLQDSSGAVLVDGKGGLGGGTFRIDVAPGIPVVAIIDRGGLSIELDTPADVDACVAAGEVSIGVPPGDYELDLAAGVGVIDVEIVDRAGADHFIRACTGAGEIDLHVFDVDALTD